MGKEALPKGFPQVLNEIWVAGLRRRGRARIRVRGLSMRPAIADGSMLDVESAEHAPPRVGDIVLVAAGGRLLCHRLVALGAHGRCRTRGDALGRQDPPWTSDQVVGRVLSVSPPGRQWRLSRAALLRCWSRLRGRWNGRDGAAGRPGA